MDFKKKIREGQSTFPMASMIDIVFILLIHFMAATIFAQWENKLDITVPTAQSALPHTRQIGEVILNIDSTGKVFINSRPISDEMLLELLTKVADTFKTQPIVLRADKATDCQALIRVLDICRQADVWNIAFATIKPDES